MKDKELQHTPDQQLLEQFYENKNTRLLGVLLQRYTLLLLGVCMKYLKNEEAAKDAVQQIFFKVINEVNRYKVQYFKSWLYMIAKNYCLMQLRNKNYTVSNDVHENVLIEEPNDIENYFENEKVLSLMEESLLQLNSEQKMCIQLFYLDKKTYQQISNETGFNFMQVKSFIQNGKRNLKLLIERKLQNK